MTVREIKTRASKLVNRAVGPDFFQNL